MRLYIFDRP